MKLLLNTEYIQIKKCPNTEQIFHVQRFGPYNPNIQKVFIIRDITVPDDSLPVQLTVPLSAGILLQPEVLQSRQVSQVADLADVRDAVLADVQFLQILAVLNVG